MYKAETQIRVRYAETDQMGVVYHGNYFQYFEVSRAEAIRHLGYTYADIESIGIIMPVVDVSCKYIKPIQYDELITVVTLLKELRKDHRIEFHHEIYNKDKELLAAGRVVLFFLEVRTMEKKPMPFVLHKKLERYFKS